MPTYNYNATGSTTNYGDNNPAVLALQKELNSKYNAGLVEDAKYGPLTQAAYQKYLGGSTGVNPNQSIGELFTGTDYSKDPNYLAAQDIFGKQLRGEDIVDVSKMRSDKIASVQDRINALNQVYADQSARVKQASAGNVGSGTAILASRGLAGSMRGEAIRQNIVTANTANENAVDNEKNLAVQGIYDAVDNAVASEAQQRREAMTSGAKNYIEFIKGQDERIKGTLNELATNYAISGTDPSKDPNISTIAQKLGVTPANIIAAYKQAKYAFDAENAKASASASGGSGSGVGSGTPGQLSALAQAVQNGTISLDKLTPTDRARVAAELSSIGIPSSRQQTLQQNLSVVDSLLNNKGLKSISGFIQGKLGLGNLTGNQLALNQYNQLKGILSLENREKLKGSGAISDFEFKVLSDAATALGRNLNDTEFKNQLTKIKEIFEGKYAYTNQTGGNISSDGTSLQTNGNNQNTLTSPDGTQEVYLSDLTPAEIEEARNAGWQ